MLRTDATRTYRWRMRLAALLTFGGLSSLLLSGCATTGADPKSTLQGLPVIALEGVDGDVLQHLRGTDEGQKRDLQWLMVSAADSIYTFLDHDNARAVLGGTEAQLQQLGNENLVSLGPVYTLAAAFYSGSLGDVTSIADGASVVLPDDLDDQRTALTMLADQQLITLGDGEGLAAIADNPKHLAFETKPLTELAAAIDTAALVYAPAEQATAAGLSNPVLLEPENQRETRILVSTASGAASGDVKALYRLLTSDATRSYLHDTWGDIVSAP